MSPTLGRSPFDLLDFAFNTSGVNECDDVFCGQCGVSSDVTSRVLYTISRAAVNTVKVKTLTLNKYFTLFTKRETWNNKVNYDKQNSIQFFKESVHVMLSNAE